MSRTHKDVPGMVKVMHGDRVLKMPHGGIVVGKEAQTIAEDMYKNGAESDSGYYDHKVGGKNSVCPGCPYCTESKKNDPYINHGKLRLIAQYANGSGLDDMWEM